jgi:hypothetical protein
VGGGEYLVKLTPQLLAEKYNLTPFNVSDPVDGDITLSVVMWSDVYFLLCGIEYEVEDIKNGRV